MTFHKQFYLHIQQWHCLGDVICIVWKKNLWRKEKKQHVELDINCHCSWSSMVIPIQEYQTIYVKLKQIYLVETNTLTFYYYLGFVQLIWKKKLGNLEIPFAYVSEYLNSFTSQTCKWDLYCLPHSKQDNNIQLQG